MSFALLEASGASFSDHGHRPCPLPAPIETPSLRPYQREALSAWLDADRRGLVALPTGSGKTRVAVAAAAALGMSTLCIVPTRVLLEPWRAAIAQVYAGEIGCYGDGTRHLAGITVSTYASAAHYMPQIGYWNRSCVLKESPSNIRPVRRSMLRAPQSDLSPAILKLLSFLLRNLRL